MHAADLLAEVARLGVELRAEGSQLLYRPPGALPHNLLEALRAHKPEILAYLRTHRTRALPTDPEPRERLCAWCRGPLDGDRRRLCRTCTDPEVEPRPLSADSPVAHRRRARISERQQGIGTARPPEPHRRCRSCGGGLQREDPNPGLCQTCRWTMERLGPRPVQ